MKLEFLVPDVSSTEEVWLNALPDAYGIGVEMERLNLNEYIVNPASSTFYVKIKGNSTSSIGILDGDVLIVDQSIDPTNSFTAIIRTNEEYLVKRIIKFDNKLYLIPENADHKRIEITPPMNISICGVVTSIIRKLVI